MARRGCEKCGKSLAHRKASARFCDDACRKAHSRRPAAKADSRPSSHVVDQESESIADALRAELEKLGVLEQYEARTTLRLARQLDSGVIIGAAFVSQSKELDRRVEELRRRAPKQDDATQAAREAVQERRLQLASG